MDDNSLLNDINNLMGSLLLGALFFGLLKSLMLACIAFVAIFWAFAEICWDAFCWTLKETGILLLRSYNVTRRLFS